MTLATQLLPWKAWQKTAIPCGAPVITPEKRAEKVQAKNFFNNILEQLQVNQSNFTQKEIQQAEKMLALLGENYPISDKKTAYNIFFQMHSISIGAIGSRKDPVSLDEKSIFKKFQDAYKDPEKAAKAPEYQELFQLIDSEDSEDKKRQILYDAFARDPIAILVCISHPISHPTDSIFKKSTSYRLMEYIFQDTNAWKAVMQKTLLHYKNIAFCNVEKLLLPIVQKALSLRLPLQTHQELLCEIILIKTPYCIKMGDYHIPQYPAIAAELLKKQTLIDNGLLETLISTYIPPFQLRVIELERSLVSPMPISIMSSEPQEDQLANFRAKSFAALPKGIQKRAGLLKKQIDLLKQAPWLMDNNNQHPPLLSSQQSLKLLKDIIEASGPWDMQYNNLLFSAGINDISDRCVKLLPTILNKQDIITYIHSAKTTFVHSAASCGKEVMEIIRAIDMRDHLHFLLAACCNYTSKAGSPLEIALQAENNWRIIEIFIKHTDDLTIWKRLIKTEHHPAINTKKQAIDLINKDYHIVSKLAYRRLNQKYRDLDQKIRNCVHFDECWMESGCFAIDKLLKTMKDPHPILHDILITRLEYLEYILQLLHSEKTDDFKVKGFQNALFDITSNELRFKEVQNFSEKYSILACWTTFLRKFSGVNSPTLENRRAGESFVYFYKRAINDIRELIKDIKLPKGSQISPITQLDPEIITEVTLNFQKWQKEKQTVATPMLTLRA